MSEINTGPTATTLHHILAALQGATGIDALWWVWILIIAVCAVTIGISAWVEFKFYDPAADASRRKGAQRRPSTPTQW